jgi:hypothetical protein
MSGRRSYSDEEVEAAVQALSAPGRLEAAQAVVMRTAPQLQRILNQALEASDWFGPAHHDAIRQAVGSEDPAERRLAVSTLLAEETRLSMLIGVAAGMELAHQLDHPQED